MNDMPFSAAQADMRQGYLDGAPGVLASSLAWLVAAGVAWQVSAPAAVLTLLAGGALIHPVGVLLARALGRRGAHTPGNPLARLAVEGTLWMLAGIAVAYGLQVLRIEWFFPAMLLAIGGRYLSFQTLYGLRVYWVMGGVLCVLGLGLALARAAPVSAALAGGLVEAAFAAALLAQARRG
ncbi:hypothetical protein KAK07_00605 [Ideonella sp. 4Y16]|uniref:Uncharacterized protein n=1 Tax=Ideonella alba TaxID=2824118 RepID=A0A941BE44_9BURK|nr:hypothetical protein [Ideonella alba]MBQ0929582.1 hypothetical protein [Ideonella alba]MBQ0941823.1 hypothetical protein [Ideonella alba]